MFQVDTDDLLETLASLHRQGAIIVNISGKTVFYKFNTDFEANLHQNLENAFNPNVPLKIF